MTSRRPFHLLAVVGARPNFVKMSALVSRLREREEFRVTLLHTRQHHDHSLSKIFFQQLELPEPNLSLEIPRGSHAEQTADTMREFDRALDQLDVVDLVLVVGDVNSTLAAALVAVKRGLRAAHVEAGLRSYNWDMPEEINRVITDRICDLLFTTSVDADENLLKEGIPAERIHRVGNVMIDTLLKHREKARACKSAEKLGLDQKDYAVLTLHRQENVDYPPTLESLVRTILDIGTRIPVVFPVHPRTKSRLREQALWSRLESDRNVKLHEPLGYLEFLDLVGSSRLVLTDSGGLQEESTVLGVDCITLRGETERPVTVSHGTNHVAGIERENILSLTDSLLADHSPTGKIPPLWDGHSAERIAEILARVLA